MKLIFENKLQDIETYPKEFSLFFKDILVYTLNNLI